MHAWIDAMHWTWGKKRIQHLTLKIWLQVTPQYVVHVAGRCWLENFIYGLITYFRHELRYALCMSTMGSITYISEYNLLVNSGIECLQWHLSLNLPLSTYTCKIVFAAVNHCFQLAGYQSLTNVRPQKFPPFHSTLNIPLQAIIHGCMEAFRDLPMPSDAFWLG
jgi:hypothetical protein